MSNTATLPSASPAETNNEDVATDWKMSALDRCDRCGAQAYIKATSETWPGGLLFCNHHGKAKTNGVTVAQSLEDKGWDVKDKSGMLYEHSKPDGGSAAG